MSVEHAPKGRRGFFGSWPQMGVPAGLLISTLVFKLVQSRNMSEAAFASWGWRVPFLASAILVIVGLVIRLKLMESPAFERVKETKTEAAMPIVDVIRKYPRNVLHRDGHADGRERRLLPADRVRLRLRRGGARPRQGHDAHRRGHRRGARPDHRAAVGVALGPRRAPAAVPGGRGRHDAVGVPVLRADGHEVAGADLGGRSWSASTSGTTSCTARRAHTSPSCSGPVCDTAAPRSATSSRRCSRAASRR